VPEDEDAGLVHCREQLVAALYDEQDALNRGSCPRNNRMARWPSALRLRENPPPFANAAAWASIRLAFAVSRIAVKALTTSAAKLHPEHQRGNTS
jgi:hypothetical protein